MNLLGIYTVGVARSLQTFTTRHSNRKLSIVMALSTTFTQYALEITEFGKNYAKMAISPFKVIQGHQFWYQSKAHIYDFLLVINTNLPPIMGVFRGGPRGPPPNRPSFCSI